MSQSSVLLELKDVHTHIGAYHILHGVNLQIPRGELTLLLGRNGADNSKPHYDTRPLLDPNLPEVREYRLRWWDKGLPNGEFSPVQKIVVVG